MCKNPFIKDVMPLGCGQCLPCRVKRRREWTNRIMLESMLHDHNAFVTLTYNDENLPPNNSLLMSDIQKWQKNLRYHANIDLRFFSVGEYGDEGKRPHYHAAVFGFKGCASYSTKCPCIACETLRASWQKGFVLNGTLTKDSASYVSGYVTKKMTDRNPQEKYEKLIKKGRLKSAQKYKEKVIDYLDGRAPEFAKMSLGSKKNPDERFQGGLGYGALPTLQSMLETNDGCDLLAELNDVPDIVKIGGKEMLLGRYLKNKLRQRIGVNETHVEEKMQKLREEKIAEYLAYREEVPKEKALSQKEFLIDKHLQKVRNLEKRMSLKNKKGVL
jgi:hypothetical protein